MTSSLLTLTLTFRGFMVMVSGLWCDEGYRLLAASACCPLGSFS